MLTRRLREGRPLYKGDKKVLKFRLALSAVSIWTSINVVSTTIYKSRKIKFDYFHLK